jgi:hypothetical protein
VAGGQKNATVRETCIQEYTAADELIFEWRAWDHFDIRDVEIENLQSNFIRFPHMNAIFIDTDGHILLSSRHLSEVTKIHRQTGAIIWRLSGANNDFAFINDQLNGFRSQHAIRALANNRYTVYDNGNLHDPPTSRAVEYELDTENMTATLVWEYRNEWPQYHSHYMGNTQRLPNGNTLINWAIGELPKLTEVRPNGEKAYEFWFSKGTHCYRTFKYPWNGKSRKPYLVVESGPVDVTLIFNQFADPDVDYYKIYAGTSPSPQALLDTSKQTLKRFTDFINGQRYYFRVSSVNKDGSESNFSNEESAEVNLIRPGENMAVNGDFSLGYDGWTWEVSGTAAAEWVLENGEAHFNITSPGSEFYNVQLRQNGIPLIQGKEYVFEFDARADAPKVVEIKVGQDSDPWTNYSRIGLLAIDSRMQHHAYTFTMESPSDFNCRIVLNLGKSTTNVYVDNISLKEVVASPVEPQKNAQIPQSFALEPNYPNPFNPATTITYRLPVPGHVELKIFNIAGAEVAQLISKEQNAGKYNVTWDATGYASGVYFCSIQAGEFNAIRKMILLK